MQCCRRRDVQEKVTHYILTEVLPNADVSKLREIDIKKLQRRELILYVGNFYNCIRFPTKNNTFKKIPSSSSRLHIMFDEKENTHTKFFVKLSSDDVKRIVAVIEFFCI